MCRDELIPRGIQVNHTWNHCLILSKSLLYPPPPLYSCYYGVIEVHGWGRVDETCNLTEREVDCVIRTWGGVWGNDHQRNENKWLVIPQEEIYPYLFLVMKSIWTGYPRGVCVFHSCCVSLIILITKLPVTTLSVRSRVQRNRCFYLILKLSALHKHTVQFLSFSSFLQS